MIQIFWEKITDLPILCTVPALPTQPLPQSVVKNTPATPEPPKPPVQVTAQLHQTAQGPRMWLQGIQGSNFTEEDLKTIKKQGGNSIEIFFLGCSLKTCLRLHFDSVTCLNYFPFSLAASRKACHRSTVCTLSSSCIQHHECVGLWASFKINQKIGALSNFNMRQDMMLMPPWSPPTPLGSGSPWCITWASAAMG